MIVEKIRELAEDLRRTHQDLRVMQSDMRMQDGAYAREADIDRVISDLTTFKLNVTYLRLKAGELVQRNDLDFAEVREEVRYFATYLKHASDTFDEICNSMAYGGRSGDDAAMQKTGEELLILQRHLREMNEHLLVINSKLGKTS